MHLINRNQLPEVFTPKKFFIYQTYKIYESYNWKSNVPVVNLTNSFLKIVNNGSESLNVYAAMLHFEIVPCETKATTTEPQVSAHYHLKQSKSSRLQNPLRT